MARAHARLGPSDANRWMTCPGSINLTEKMKGGDSTEWSAEGTFAHTIREESLDLGFDAHDWIGRKGKVDGFKFEWTKVDADYLQPGLDRIREFHGRRVLEYRVTLDRWMPDDFGTLDVGIICKNLIVINDLKWGKGIPVDVMNNRQLRIYALGFWWNVARHETDAKEFLLMIDQPRVKGHLMSDRVQFQNLDEEEEEDDDDGLEQLGGNEWRVTLKDLLKFGEEVKAAAKRTHDPFAPRVPSEKACRWCPAAKIDGKCLEFENHNMRALGITFDNLDETGEIGLDVRLNERITPQRRTYLLRNWPMIERWYKRMHAQALVDALSGDFDRVPGLKAVDGRHGKRVWTDEEVAEAYLLEHLGPKKAYAPRKILSPAGAEKLLGKGNINSALIHRGEPKPVLVDEHDPKPAKVTENVEFEDLDAENDVND